MPHHPLPLAVALALSPSLAQAQDATDLDEVLVTATRTETALVDSLAPAEVIGRAEIERSQARSLPDLLRGRVGIDVGNQGGPGKLATVFIRGSESDHVLVLVDGVRIGSATAGLAAFQDLPLEHVERIEIVRGPRSSLYGSEAIGGVIHIFTRRDRGPLATRLRLGGGSHGLREASAGLGGAVGEGGWLGADVAHSASDGINACRGTASAPGAPFGAGCFTNEPDRDGYRNRSLNLRGGLAIGEALALSATALRADSHNEFDGGPFGGNEAENVQQAIGVRLTHAHGERLRLTLQGGRSDDRSDNFFAGAAGARRFVSTFDTRRDTASAQLDVDVAGGRLLTVGSDWQRDAIASTTAFAATRRDNAAGFLAFQGEFAGHRVEASLRNDDNEQFGDHATGSLGWGHALGASTRLALGYATGFKAPSFNDLYFPFFGNPALRPERSASINAGLRGTAADWRWTLDAFETRVDDLVTFDAAIFLPNNLEQARIRGAELSLAGTWSGWDMQAQLSHADPRNRTPGPNFGNRLPRRARTTGSIALDRSVGEWRVGGTLAAAGPRYDDAANRVRLGGHATLDLRAEWTLAPAWTLQARVTNVLDRDYETVAWYNQPGREFGLHLRYASSP